MKRRGLSCVAALGAWLVVGAADTLAGRGQTYEDVESAIVEPTSDSEWWRAESLSPPLSG